MKLTRRTASLLMAAFLAVLTGCVPTPAPTPLAAPTSTPTAEAPDTLQAVDTFDTRIRAGDGVTMVYVPAGQFEAALTPSSYRMHWVGIRCAVSAGP